MRFIFTTIISLTMSFALPLHGQTNTLSHEEMFERLSKLAAKGDPEIKYNLGMFLNNGIGTKRDQKAAFAQFSEAASAGSALASYKVGCYYAGQFLGAVTPDEDLAFKFKLVAAEAGYDLAQTDVGMTFAKRGDLPAAANWWERASKQGNNSATAFLAGYYLGKSSQDKNKGLALLLKLRETVPTLPKNVEDLLTAAEAKATPEDRIEAEKIRVSWVIERTPITIAARRGIAAVPLLLEQSDR